MTARCLITGITGMVGSHLAEYLLANTDWEIHGMLRWRSPLDNVQALLPLVNDPQGRVKFHYADLRDSESMGRMLRGFGRLDYVFHLAAQSYPKTSFDSPCDTLDTNIQGTVRLLDILREREFGPWIHVCSSSEVYGRAKTIPIAEDAPFHPASPYAISKVGTDLVARHYAEAYGMKIVVTRMFTHTGPRRGDVFMESTFAKQIAMAEAGLIAPVIRVGNLKSLRTVADVRDAVRAYYMLLTVNPQAGEVYNIGGTHTAQVGDILDYLISLATIPLKVEGDPARLRPIDADLQVPDCTKFCEHTGWTPGIPFEQTMGDLLDYWRERVKTTQFLTR
ncbi:MAG: GDP-mannose 4,6-dehydratase [Sulfuricaulis sp.]|nr:GDP-mannose 4,6-dehydratase [Sulfuricaulis sp.]